MEEVLVVALQLFFEFFLQLLGSGFLDAASGRGGKNDGCFYIFLHTIVGGGLGFVSTLVVPHLVIPFLWLRLLNLVVAPLVAGSISYGFASWAKSKGNDSNADSHFLHGFLFALMFGLARFAFAAR